MVDAPPAVSLELDPLMDELPLVPDVELVPDVPLVPVDPLPLVDDDGVVPVP